MEAQDLSLRVASFSYYLNNNNQPEDSFVHKIWPGSSNMKIPKTNNNFTFNSSASSRPVQDPTVAFILPHKPNQIVNVTNVPRNHPKSSQKDDETTVFRADKYFNTNPKDFIKNDVLLSKSQGQQEPRRQQSYRLSSATPSVFSKSGSLNSQMALLPNIIKQKKGVGRRLWLGFACRSSCSDKKSVFISDESKGVEHFATNRGCLRDENCMVEPRKSLEVFGGVDNKMSRNGDVSVNLERKLSMLTWDAIVPIPSQNNNNNITISNTICDDRASDASSDLFEIENISTNTGYGYVPSSQTADYTSVCSSPTQYAPSEASIQWSVVTASAVDYASSVVSDFCDEKYIAIHKVTEDKNSATTKSLPKIRPGGLLGCKNHKAVSVIAAASVPKR